MFHHTVLLSVGVRGMAGAHHTLSPSPKHTLFHLPLSPFRSPGEGVILDYRLMENYCIHVAWLPKHWGTVGKLPAARKLQRYPRALLSGH